jgi:hypothetical protein
VEATKHAVNMQVRMLKAIAETAKLVFASDALWGSIETMA